MNDQYLSQISLFTKIQTPYTDKAMAFSYLTPCILVHLSFIFTILHNRGLNRARWAELL